MKAALINDYGGKEVMQVSEAAKPTISSEQVLIEVHAAGINPFDFKVRQGAVRQMAELNFPAILGGDLSGLIVEVGEAVSGFEVGQAVYGQANALSGHGSYAEFAPAKASSIAPKPQSLDFEQAAALPLASVSAYQAIIETLALQPNQKLLIHGGAGGIGSLAIQLAKGLGAYVATTVGPNDQDFARKLGADEVIDYSSRTFQDVIHDYDAVFDTVGGDSLNSSYPVLKPGGKLVTMAGPVNEELASQYNIEATAQLTKTTTERLQKIAELVDNGQLKVYIDKSFSLNQAAEALEYQHQGHPKGKVVLKIRD